MDSHVVARQQLWKSLDAAAETNVHNNKEADVMKYLYYLPSQSISQSLSIQRWSDDADID